MAIKERYQNPVVGDNINLKIFAYNTNNRADFYSVEKVEIYVLDKSQITPTNPDGRVLIETIPNVSIEHLDVGLYQTALYLDSTKYVTQGQYLDVWYVRLEPTDTTDLTIENNFYIYPNLFYTSPIPIVYDFNFAVRPNKLRKGSKRYLIIDIIPNVPKASDLARYYENLAICTPVKISIMAACTQCMPAEEDLKLIVDNADVELREKAVGYYFIDTTEYKEGIYDVWFQMEFGGNTYISDRQQIQIY